MAEEVVMSPGDEEWLKRWLLARRERMRAVNEALRDQLRHSYDQIKKSYDLLKQEPPKVWPGQAPKDREPSP